MILIKRRGFGRVLNWRKMSNIALVCTFWHNWLNPLPEIWQRPIAWRWRLMLLFFSTRQHCPRPSKMYIRYLYPPSNIFVVSLFFYRHFNIALFQNRFQISLSTSLYFLSLRYLYCPQKYCWSFPSPKISFSTRQRLNIVLQQNCAWSKWLC